LSEKVKILYVEDEPFLARVVRDSLDSEGYDVIYTNDGAKAFALYQQHKPQLCLLDIMLPNTDGISIAEKVRQEHKNIPIVLITAKGEGKDVVSGFNSGATEYIKKPFSLDELHARLKHQLKVFLGAKEVRASIVEIDGLSFSATKQVLQVNSTIYELSFKEASILSILLERANTDVERDFIMQSVWQNDDYYTSRNLDVYIRKLRQYLQNHATIEILTLKGIGYRLVK